MSLDWIRPPMDDDPNAFFCRGTSSLGHRKKDTLSRIRPHHNQSFGIGVCAVAPEPMRQIGAEVQTIVCTQAVFFGGSRLQPIVPFITMKNSCLRGSKRSRRLD